MKFKDKWEQWIVTLNAEFNLLKGKSKEFSYILDLKPRKLLKNIIIPFKCLSGMIPGYQGSFYIMKDFQGEKSHAIKDRGWGEIDFLR